MTNEKNEIGADEAQEALDAIGQAERAGLSRAMPPRWFGAIIALITGGLVASATVGNTGYVGLLLCGLVIVMGVRERKAGASPKSMPSTKVGYLALFGLMVFFLLLVGASRILLEGFGLMWAPLAGGALMAAIVYGLSLSERRHYAAIIDQDKDQ